jgi:hypothetical protein
MKKGGEKEKKNEEGNRIKTNKQRKKKGRDQGEFIIIA